MENIWKMLQDIIYDRLPIRNIGDITEEIEKAIFLINATKRATIKNLYDSFWTRLIYMIEKKGNEINGKCSYVFFQWRVKNYALPKNLIL